MSLNWINPEEFSIYSLLLMDEYIVQSIANKKDPEFRKYLAIVLKQHSAILWYFQNKAPETAAYFSELVTQSADTPDHKMLSIAENHVINELDWAIVYVFPEYMEQLKYIKYWDESHLLSMTDFRGKAVLDVGAGSGRLTFAAAKLSDYVYACEPVDRLRRFNREKIKKNSIKNVYVVDGQIEDLPFRDNSFDITMSGHTIGDDYDVEYAELSRVTKPAGFIIDCPGEDDRKNELKPEMVRLGFEYSYYGSSSGGDVYRYIKQLK